jgi:Carboxypeptidase regulatory-like domain/TonB dependent receptor
VHFLRNIVVLFVAFVVALPLTAQMPNGSITGLVLDPMSHEITGADILVINDATGVKYSTKTNNDGIYVVPNLPPGPYRLQVSKLGFKTLIKPDIALSIQDSLSINFTLPVGAAFDSVTVEAGTPLINTESAAVGTVINRNFVSSLPLNGRGFNTLLQLTPGVTVAPSSTDNGSPGQFSISGQRTDSNNFSIDGVSANFGVSPGVGGLGQSGTGNAQAFSAVGGTSSLVSVDALQEFRIETSSEAPEFGRASGGQVMLTTRSGTNDLHGGVFEYFRNTVMDANDWFAEAAGDPRAPEHHNDFGGFLGGPIWKNKTFYFLSYEGARLDVPQTGLDQVPSAYARSIAPAALLPLLNAFPLPDDRTIVPGVYTSRFTGSYANKANLDAGSIRLDHYLNGRVSVFARYNYAPSNTISRNVNLYTLSTSSATRVDTQTLTVGVSVLVNPNTTNVFRANYSTQDANLSSSLDTFGGAIPPSPANLQGGLNPAGTYAYFYPFDANLAASGPQGRNRTRQINFVDDLEHTQGTHQVKFGMDYRGIFLDATPARNTLTQTVTSVQDFLATGQVNLSAETTVPAHLYSQALSLFAQDTWKATPRLTLTYGIRWEWNPAPSARGNTTLAAWENVDNPSQLGLAPLGSELWKTTLTNFAPRLGIVYRLTKDGNFVVRAGGGTFYDLSVGSSAQLAVSFPNVVAAEYQGVGAPISNVSQYLPALSLQPPYPFVSGVDPNLRLPRSYQWNLSLERGFGRRQALSVAYVGQAGRSLLRSEALYQPNSDFTGEFVLTRNDAFSNYHALQVQFRRTISTSLQALINYSWAHSLDNSSSDQVIGLSDTVVSGARDYASSDFDVRQSFSGAISYSIPTTLRSGFLALLTRDWSIESVVVARTGFPFNAIVVGTSPDPGGIVRTRPDLVPGRPLWIPASEAPGGKMLDYNPVTMTGAFQVPSTPRQGTEGRNDIPGFGMTQADLSVSRKFPLWERLNLQFRADAFNVLNHPNFTNPLGYIQFGNTYLQSLQMLNQGLGGLNPIFQQGGPRSLQLSLRLSF